MKVLIIEDEQPAAKRLTKLLKGSQPDAEVLEVLDSVEDSVTWFQSHSEPDLVFMDIQLADGQSFEIFEQCSFESPVIFTTAYDEYALKAFKVNSLDYLLKPIDPEELKAALDKFDRKLASGVSSKLLKELRQQLQPSYKERFLIKIGDQLKYIPVRDVAYFQAKEGGVFLHTEMGKRLLIDHKLEDLEQLLDPAAFLRINRAFVIQLKSVQKIHSYFNSRYKLELNPATKEEVIVSRDRSKNFKKWLDA